MRFNDEGITAIANAIKDGWQSLKLTTVSPYSTEFADQTISVAGNTTNSAGYRIYTNINCFIVSILKTSDCTATIGVLKTDTGNTTIATATFIGDVATFSVPQSLTAGTYYRVECNNSGGAYAYSMLLTGNSYPYNNTYLNFTNGSYNGSSLNYCFNILNIVVSKKSTYIPSSVLTLQSSTVTDNEIALVFELGVLELNGETINTSALSKDAGVTLESSESYSDIVKDDLTRYRFTYTIKLIR